MTRILLLILVVFSIAYIAYPEMDMVVSGWFYKEGEGFPYRENFFMVVMYNAIYVITYSLGILLPGLITLRYLSTRIPALKRAAVVGYRPLIFLMMALILGPGLIVHQGFKPFFERARPVNIEAFGGSKTYTPAFVISDQKGKSFVSGHAAMGFYMSIFGLLASGRRRAWFLGSGLLFGFVAAGARIVQGAHYLSDVVYGGLLILLLNQFLYWFIFRKYR